MIKKRNSTDEKIREKLFNKIKYNLKKVETWYEITERGEGFKCEILFSNGNIVKQ